MRKKRIILAVILGVAAILAVIAYSQRDNISAAIKSVSYSEEEIDRMLEENKKKLEEELFEKYPGVSAELTEEEEKMIASGEVTPEEIVEKKVAELKKKQSEESEKTNGSAENAAPQKLQEKKANDAVNKKIIEFYSLKAYYLGRLGQIEAGVKADYASLPAEKKNLVGKQELVSKYMSTAVSLLNQCDSKVASLLSELEAEIKANGGDLSVISTIKNAYENEKNLKKAYYMSKLK